jgi:hypothetical protein
VHDNSLFLRDSSLFPHNNSLFRGAPNSDEGHENSGRFKVLEKFSAGTPEAKEKNSLYFSLLAGNLVRENGSLKTASTASLLNLNHLHPIE